MGPVLPPPAATPCCFFQLSQRVRSQRVPTLDPRTSRSHFFQSWQTSNLKLPQETKWDCCHEVSIHGCFLCSLNWCFFLPENALSSCLSRCTEKGDAAWISILPFFISPLIVHLIWLHLIALPACSSIPPPNFTLIASTFLTFAITLDCDVKALLSLPHRIYKLSSVCQSQLRISARMLWWHGYRLSCRSVMGGNRWRTRWQRHLT